MNVIKQVSILLIVTFSKLVLFAQANVFTLHLTIKNCSGGYLQMRYLFSVNAASRKYALNKSGEILITGKMAYPGMVYLVLNDSLFTQDFFIKPGRQNIVLNARSQNEFSQPILKSGSEINDEYFNHYVKSLQPFRDNLDGWDRSYDSEKALYQENFPDSVLFGLNRKYSIFISQLDSVKRKYFIENPDSYISLWMIYENSYFLYNLDLVFDCFSRLDTRLRNTPLGRDLGKRLTVQKALLTGKHFPDFILKDSSGKEIHLAQSISTKYTLIDFWFSHCGPCIADLPKITRIYNKFRDRGFNVISITVDQEKDRNEWKKLIVDKALIWPQYWDINAIQSRKLYIDSFPTSLLLDSTGKIIDKNMTLELLEEFLIKKTNDVDTNPG